MKRPILWGPGGAGRVWLENHEPFWAGFLDRCNIKYMSPEEEKVFDRLSEQLQNNAIKNLGITDKSKIDEIRQEIKLKKTAIVFIQNRVIQIRLNKEHMASLSPKEQALLLKHEVAHPLQNHMSKIRRLGLMQLNPNPEVHNLVTDLEINDNIVPILDKDRGHLPSWKDFPGLESHRTAEEYLKKLMAMAPKQQQKGEGQGQGQEQSQEQEGTGNGTGKGQKKKEGQGQGQEQSQEKREIELQDIVGGGQEGINPDDESHQMSEEDIKGTLQKAVERGIQRSHGNVPGEVESVVTQWMKPTINWEQELKKFQTHAIRESWDETWSRKHKRISLDPWPGRIWHHQPRVAWAIDDSGSMADQKLFSQAIAESHKCAKVLNATLEVFIADTRIHDTIIIKPTDKPPKNFPLSGGGTSFVEVINHVDNSKIKYDCLFYFTDTFGTFPPKPRIPVCWIVPEEYGDVKVPYGKLIRVRLREEK